MKKLLLFLVSIICFTALPALAGNVERMTATELKSMLGSSELIILDVRSGMDWSTSELKITGAIRANGDDFASWANTYPKEKKIVLYCA
jgi:rhodanese-related sulfurtransferase